MKLEFTEVKEILYETCKPELQPQKQKNKNTLELSVSGYCKHCHLKFSDQKEHEDYVKIHDKKRFFCREHATCTEKYGRHELIKHCIENEIHIADLTHFFQRARCKASRIKNFEGEPCEICFKKFPTKKIMEKHIISDHEDQYFCEVCKKGFKRIIDYVADMQTHSEDKMYECPLCGLRKEKKYQIGVHIFQAHEQFRRFKCKLCEKRFSTYTIYDEHVKYCHNGEKPFVCDLCGKRFMYSWYLSTHKQVLHDKVSRERVKCPLCDVTLASVRGMQAHLNKQHQLTTFVCDICGKVFKTKANLISHLKVHKGDKKFKCAYCEKMFLKTGARTEHERVHTGDKPYKCTFCMKAFTQRNSLVIHMRSHTGERPYVCQICDRGYTSKTALVNHMKNCNGKNNLDINQ